MRITDHMNSEIKDKFIAVKDVEIYLANNDSKPIRTCSFINMNIDNIILLHPLEEDIAK